MTLARYRHNFQLDTAAFDVSKIRDTFVHIQPRLERRGVCGPLPPTL